MLFFLFLCGLLFGYLIGYAYGWHKALGNTEVFQPPENVKIFK